MDEDNNSYDLSYGSFSSSYGGLGLGSPSFSNDIKKIKSIVDKSKLQHASRKQGDNNENEDDDKKKLPDKKKDELGDKDKLEDKKDKKKSEDGKDKKDDKKEKKSDNKGDKKSKGLLSKKDDLNIKEKLKTKFNLIKVKIILISIAVFMGLIMVVATVAVIAGMFGIFDTSNSSNVDVDTINPDDYDIRSDKDVDELMQEIDDSYVKDDEEAVDGELTEQQTDDTTMDGNSEDVNGSDNSEEPIQNNNQFIPMTE